MVLLLGGSAVSAQAQGFNRDWEFSTAAGNNPSYIGTDNDARGLAYGVVDDGQGNMVERVFVVTGGNDPYAIQVLRASDGTDTGNDLPGVGSLSTPNDGRTVTDVAVTDDGVIIACNEVNNAFTNDGATENFRCYRWDSLTDSPSTVINYTPPDENGDGEGDWLGRQFTVIGAASDNSLTLLAAAAQPSTNVYRFTTSDNGQSFSAEVITRGGRPPSGNINAVAPVAPGNADFLFNELTTQPIRYNADGSEEVRDQGAFASFSHSLKYFEVDGRAWVAAFRWDTNGENQFAQLVEVTSGFGQALPYASTPNFGRQNPENNTNGTGDVDVRINGNNTATIYVLATNNGIGAYTTTTGLPVELASFDATQDGASVTLTWETVSETKNAGFHVERALGDRGFSEIGFREGAGTTSAPQSYRFRDADVPFTAETIRYRLRQADTDGSVEYSDPVTVQRSAERVQLRSSMPNPVVGQATIQYAVPERSNVRLAVYDLLGREVAVLAEGRQQGRQQVQVDASGWASGTYLVRLETESTTITRRLTVVQ
jgi:hypothetical protein